MKTHLLRINANNLRKEIHHDFFKYRDIFYKCLVANLAVYNQMYANVLSTTILEDAAYNQYLLSLVNRQASLEEILKDIDSPYIMSIFLDTQVNFEDFIRSYHSGKKLNVYQLTIDDQCHIYVTNKHLRIHHAVPNTLHHA